MKAIIAAAGKSTRLYPLTITRPKPITKILNKSILEYNIESLRNAGVTEIIIVIAPGEYGQKITDYFNSVNSNGALGVNLMYVPQPSPIGTANAFYVAHEFFPDSDTMQENAEEVLFLNGDDIYHPEDIRLLIENAGPAIVTKTVEDWQNYGVLTATPEGNVDKVVEKPTEYVGNQINLNLFKVNANMFSMYGQILPSPRGEMELTDLFLLFSKTYPLKIISTENYWLPVTYPWSILDVTHKLADTLQPKVEGTIEANVTINGNLVLPASSTIKAGTYIEGNVIVGENTVIGPNAHIRGNTAIGSNCKIGFGVEVKSSVLGDNCRLSHLAYLGDSVLGKDVTFSGMCITANLRHDEENVKSMVKDKLIDTGLKKFGTAIGDGAKLGVGTKIYPGRKMWPNTTTVPGEVVTRDVTE